MKDWWFVAVCATYLMSIFAKRNIAKTVADCRQLSPKRRWLSRICHSDDIIPFWRVSLTKRRLRFRRWRASGGDNACVIPLPIPSTLPPSDNAAFEKARPTPLGHASSLLSCTYTIGTASTRDTAYLVHFCWLTVSPSGVSESTSPTGARECARVIPTHLFARSRPGESISPRHAYTHTGCPKATEYPFKAAFSQLFRAEIIFSPSEREREKETFEIWSLGLYEFDIVPFIVLYFYLSYFTLNYNVVYRKKILREFTWGYYEYLLIFIWNFFVMLCGKHFRWGKDDF